MGLSKRHPLQPGAGQNALRLIQQDTQLLNAGKVNEFYKKRKVITAH